MQNKFGVICNYGDKVMLRTRNSLKNQSKGNNSNTEQGRDSVLVHCTSSHCQKHAYQVWSIQTYGDKLMLRTRNAL